MRSCGRLPSLIIGGIQRPDFRNVGKIRERRSAIQATGIFKVDELAARVTVEDSH
jgi:hypothetical protein